MVLPVDDKCDAKNFQKKNIPEVSCVVGCLKWNVCFIGCEIFIKFDI